MFGIVFHYIFVVSMELQVYFAVFYFGNSGFHYFLSLVLLFEFLESIEVVTLDVHLVFDS